jgi:phosphoesterase RecJ-like protein
LDGDFAVARNSEFAEILERLRAAKRLLCVTHSRPDGDTLGSAAAVVKSARLAGKQAGLVVPDRVPARYEFLFDAPPAGVADFESLADAADTIIVLDTSAAAQLDGVAEGLRRRRDKVIVVDHHATSEDLGAVQWVDTSAAAAGVLAEEIIEALGWPMDLAAAEALAVAITSDTGWLRFANTDARCLRTVARLLEPGPSGAGVRMDKLYMRLFQCDRPQRLRLTARMLQSLELHCSERLATMMIRKADFDATGALPEETENLVNEALRMACVETAILLVENGPAPDGGGPIVRVSLRSRDEVDVAAVAARFGGGGHARAAGIRAAMPIEKFRDELVKACAEALNKL